jgi:tRNA threonylcarbamoyladenosine biosynthesis protein TsaE
MEYNISTVKKLQIFCDQYQVNNSDPYKFLLSGDLGAGKTTFTQTFFKDLFPEAIIQSPTYNLVFEYENPSKQKLMHFDLYRLEKDKEADQFLQEYTEYFSPNNIVIEWPERLSETMIGALRSAGFESLILSEKEKSRMIEIIRYDNL